MAQITKLVCDGCNDEIVTGETTCNVSINYQVKAEDLDGPVTAPQICFEFCSIECFVSRADHIEDALRQQHEDMLRSFVVSPGNIAPGLKPDELPAPTDKPLMIEPQIEPTDLRATEAAR